MTTEVTKNFYRGRRSDTLEAITKYKVTHVVNVEWGFWDLFRNDNYDNIDFYLIDITEIRIRMSDFLLDPIRLIRAVNTIADLLDKGFIVFLHCFSGKDRTGIVVVFFRVYYEGWTWAKALDEWVQMGRHFW
ncbi:MAG TPA: tyrosine-protein phosphatase, partial [Candidatus Babeliaceae bacterium]|nr:tyrosine-protein phosphatase [Candidatus Babeliaceae bacterium]